MTIEMALIILALASFILAAYGVPSRISLVPFGLALLTVTLLI